MGLKSVRERPLTDIIIVVTPAPVLEDELAVLGLLNVFECAIVGAEASCDKKALRRVKYVILCDFVIKHGSEYVNIISLNDSVNFDHHIQSDDDSG